MSVPQIVVVVTRIDGLAGAGVGPRDLLDADVARAVEDGRAHRVVSRTRGSRSFGTRVMAGLQQWWTERRRGAARPGCAWSCSSLWKRPLGSSTGP